MTIEIRQPELEALIRQRMASGRFRSLEEMLMQALEATDETTASTSRQSLEDLFAKVRGLSDDLDISREPFDGRSAHLS